MLLIEVAGQQFTHGAFERELTGDKCQRLLNRARKDRLTALCHCTTPPRRLVIRKLKDHHFLAAWPDDASAHAYACRFHSSPEDRSDRTRVQQSAIIDDDGRYRVALTVAWSGVVGETPRPAATKPGDIGLLQLALYLFERGRLNCWARGWTRDYWRVWRAVEHELAKGQLVDGARLRDMVYMPQPFRPDRASAIDQAWEHFSSPLCHVGQGKTCHRRIVFGEVKELLTLDTGGATLALKHLRVRLHLSRNVHEALFQEHSRAMSMVGLEAQYHARIMFIALVQPDQAQRQLDVVEGAFLLCNEYWIPVGTKHELQLANLLVGQDRTFERPVPLLGERSSLPDFVLLDGAQPTALEVFGLDSLSYEERKFGKIGRLREQGLEIWVWRAGSGTPIPALPALDHAVAEN